MQGFNVTPEMLAKAQLARKEKRENGLATFRTNYLDDARWVELAKEAGDFLGVKIKLPQHHIAPSGRKLVKLAEQLGLPDNWGEAMFGINFTNPTAAIKIENTRRADGEKYNHRCYVGHVLEMWKEMKSV